MAERAVPRLFSVWYRDYEADLLSAFIVRIVSGRAAGSFSGIMSPFTWLFLASYRELREKPSQNFRSRHSSAPYHAFFDSAFVPICASLFFGHQLPTSPVFTSTWTSLWVLNSAERATQAIREKGCTWRYRATTEDFHEIPGAPIAYSIHRTQGKRSYATGRLATLQPPGRGLITGDNERFLRFWWEVSGSQFGRSSSGRDAARRSGKRWFPYQKGGAYRKWYGNNEYVVDWKNDGQTIRSFTDNAGKLRSRTAKP